MNTDHLTTVKEMLIFRWIKPPVLCVCWCLHKWKIQKFQYYIRFLSVGCPEVLMRPSPSYAGATGTLHIKAEHLSESHCCETLQEGFCQGPSSEFCIK